MNNATNREGLIMRKVQCYFVVVFIICMAWQTVFAEGKGSPIEWYQRGMALKNKHMYEEAIKMYTKAIELDKIYVDAYLQRGQAYGVIRATEPHVSMSDFEQAIAIDPTNAEAHYQHGLLNFFLLNIEYARADMKTAAGLGHEGAKEWLGNFPLKTKAKSLTEIKKETDIKDEATAAREKRPDLRKYLPSKSEPMIHFDFDKTNIKKDFHFILDEVAGVLKNKLPDVKIIVTGHTDSTGKETYNEELSLARAAAVKSYLESQHGIRPALIITTGHGPNNPIDTNETKEGRAKNRRAHIQIAGS